MALRDRLLTFLEAYWETHGYGPTLEEIRRHVGLSSRSSITCGPWPRKAGSSRSPASIARGARPIAPSPASRSP